MFLWDQYFLYKYERKREVREQRNFSLFRAAVKLAVTVTGARAGLAGCSLDSSAVYYALEITVVVGVSSPGMGH